MDLRTELQKVIDTGIKPGTFARLIGRDPTTIYRYLEGKRDISDEVWQEIADKIREMKQQWENIKVN